MKRIIFIVSLLITAIVFTMAVPASSGSSLSQAPRIPVKQGTSTNWSGYAVQTDLNNPQKNVVTNVKGSWVVPAVTGPSTTGSYYSSMWVGIDGYSSSSVEQIGTASDWINGQARYYAWYEMYPKPSYTIKYAVSPGDIINAEVKYTNKGSFTLTLVDVGKWSFSTNQKSNKAQRNSAEWVVEAPWWGGVLPLANFGTATFTNASATIQNITGTISAWPNDAINMVTSSGSLKAETGPLSTDGSGFTVTWKSN